MMMLLVNLSEVFTQVLHNEQLILPPENR